MKPNYTVLLALCLFLGSGLMAKSKKILIFCKTAGYHHSSIPVAVKAIQQLGKTNKFSVDTTTNSALFTENNLKKYDAVVFLSTTGDVLNPSQQEAFENYIKSGKGFVGIHAATDTEYDWPWYGKLVGAYFAAHPKQQEAVLNIVDRNHVATKHLPSPWKRKDEWYNFKSLQNGLNVLITIDEKSYNPGAKEMGDHHPMSWYHEYDGGRAFYTALGHTEESYADPLFLKHILGGIKYATGK